MSIPGTLTYEGPTAVPQANIDEIPTSREAFLWLVANADTTGFCYEENWDEAGYEHGAVWFVEDVAGVASDLSSNYGFDCYDQGSSKYYAFLPDDRVAS